MKQYAIGVDIGGSHVCTCAVALETGRLAAGSLCSRKVDCHAPARTILGEWADAIRRSAGAVGDGAIAGIGMALPGPFDYVRGISLIEGVDKFEHLFGLDLAASLPPLLGEYGRLPLRYVNDASAFALGEYHSGAGRGSQRMIALTLGTGIGSGFVDGGRLVTEGPEVPANGWVYHLPFAETIVDDQFSTRWFLRRHAELSGRDAAGVKEIAEAAADDALARRIFDEYGVRFAEFLPPLCRAFSCRKVVLGGNISRAWPLFAPALHEALARAGADLDLSCTELHDNAVMAGAAQLFRDIE